MGNYVSLSSKLRPHHTQLLDQIECASLVLAKGEFTTFRVVFVLPGIKEGDLVVVTEWL